MSPCSKTTRSSLIWVLVSSGLCHGFMGVPKPVLDWKSLRTSSRKALLNPNEESSNSVRIGMIQLPNLFPDSFLRPNGISRSLRQWKNQNEMAAQQLAEKVATFSRARRIGKLPVEKLVEALDYELYRSQWFVTGQVNPAYFCKDFVYEDPDVQYYTLEEYAMDVHALFDQSVSKAEIVCIEADDERTDIITCTWRLSGRANLLWGIDIKPLYVYTEFVINEANGLIQSQEDRYSLPHWDLLLSSVFPFLNGIVTAPEAPPVSPRIVTPSRHEVTPKDAFISRSRIISYFGGTSVPADLLERFEDSKRSAPSRTLPITSCSTRVPFPTHFGDPDNSNSSKGSILVYREPKVVGQPPLRRSSKTRPVTPEEAAKMIRGDGSPLNGLVHFVQEGLIRHNNVVNRKNPAVPWYAALVVYSVDEDDEEPEIRAILADGTKVPAIRAPTWKDKAKLYLHIDHSGTVANLKEASRRAESRRHNKYYSRHSGEEGYNLTPHDYNTMGRGTAPVSYFVPPNSQGDEV